MYCHPFMLLTTWAVWSTCLARETSKTFNPYSPTSDQSLNALLPRHYHQALEGVEILLPINDTVFLTKIKNMEDQPGARFKSFWLHHQKPRTYIYFRSRRVYHSNAIYTTCIRMPNDSRMHPTVGNGHIATVVLSNTICMNGIYSGMTKFSHRARIPSAAGIKLTISTNKTITQLYALNVQHGLFTHVNYIENMGSVVETIYAHRQLKEVLVVEINIERSRDYDEDIQVDLHMNYTSSKDLYSLNETHDLPNFDNVTYFHGLNINSEEYDAKQKSVHVIYTNVPSKLVLPRGEKNKTFYFLTAVGTKKNQVISAFQKAMGMAKKHVLVKEHANAWLEIWKNGYIDVRGDSQLSQITYAAQYYILSSLPSIDSHGNTDFVGLSPSGLAHGLTADDYGGHVFWDQDIWIFPPVLVLHSDLAKVLMKTRTRTLDAARARAAMNDRRGAMYPWESAQTGMETSNSLDVARFEQHVTGDIAFAAEQYLYMSNDLDFFKNERGVEMIESIANFWIYRVALDKKLMKYIITDVMGPDEYQYPVNNSIYTNYIAVKSLDMAIYCFELLGKKSEKTMLYEIIKEDMYLPFDSKLQYHPEYDGYKQGTTVKQADVILLGYPLMMNMPKSVRYNDLINYGKVSDENGPAMTWSMFSISWLELNNTLKANTYFEKNFGNVIGPFKMWSEYKNGKGAVNFLTGMGGFLQGLIFGYSGFRIHKDRLEFDPQLPLNSTSVTLNNIDYRGSSFTLSFNDTIMALTLTEPGNDELIISLRKSEINITFPLRRTIHFPIERTAIFVKDVKPYTIIYSSSRLLKSSSHLLFLSFVFCFKLHSI